MKRVMVAAALAAWLAASACSGAPGEPDAGAVSSLGLPAESASIIGDVTQVEGSGARILVEQVPTRSAGYPIAWVSVTSRTRILARRDGQTSRASAADLREGARVHVWFTGGVRESWPVQADAGTILIER
jgi:hypothetical protein